MKILIPTLEQTKFLQSAEEAQVSMMSNLPVTPEKMLANEINRHHLRCIVSKYKSKPKTEHLIKVKKHDDIEWSDFNIDLYETDSASEESLDISENCDLIAESIKRRLLKLFPRDTKAWDDDQVENLYKFIEKPNKKNLDDARFLKKIPNVIDLVKESITYLRYLKAKYILEYVNRSYCLKVDIDLKSNIGDYDLKPFHLYPETHNTMQVWLHIEQDDSGIPNSELMTMSMWKYAASFVLIPDSGGDSKLIAVAKGHHITPFKKKYLINENEFFEAMDAHSAYLNDVWKVITGKFLVSFGKSLHEYAEEGYGGFMVGFNALRIDTDENFKGRRLAAPMMNVLTKMFEDSSSYEILNKNDHKCYFADIGVFIVAVEGTIPEKPEINMLLRDNLDTLPIKKVVAFGQEKKKVKLTKYFKSLSPLEMGPQVIVYDPWDYPTT